MSGKPLGNRFALFEGCVKFSFQGADEGKAFQNKVIIVMLERSYWPQLSFISVNSLIGVSQILLAARLNSSTLVLNSEQNIFYLWD